MCLKEYGTPPRNLTAQNRHALDFLIKVNATQGPSARPGVVQGVALALVVVVAAIIFLVLSPAILPGLVVYGWLKDITEPARQRWREALIVHDLTSLLERRPGVLKAAMLIVCPVIVTFWSLKDLLRARHRPEV